MTPTGPSLEVLLANAGWMRRLARRLARDEGEAEDLVQETWLAALRRGPGDEPPASWLAQVLRNLASKAERSRRHRHSREALAARPEKLASTAELYERARLQRELASAVLELGEPYASTILLRYFEGLPPRAIARRHGVSVSTVKTRLTRGQERLRERLEREHGGREAWLAALLPLLYPASAPDPTHGALLVNAKLNLAVAMAVAVAMISLLALRSPWRRISELVVSAPALLSDAAPTRKSVADRPPPSSSPYGPLFPARLSSQVTSRELPMTLSHTLSNRTLATHFPWWTSAAIVLSIAALPAAAQNQLWIHQLGTNSIEYSYAAAPDGSGGVFMSGWTDGSLSGTNAGSSDAWLARYDSAGKQLWIRQLGSSSLDWAYAAAPDGSGGAYVSGFTYGDLGGPNAGGVADLLPNADVWLARYDGAGNQLWIRQLGASASDYTYAAAPDGSGGVYVSGWTDGSLVAPSAGGIDAWLAHYDNAGNQLWIRQLGTSALDDALAAAPDGSGGVYVGGHTLGHLGGANAGSYDAWLARYDGAGNQLWIRQLGTSDLDRVEAAAPDGSGGVYVTGWTTGGLGGPNAGNDDAWLAHYDSTGNQLWIQQLGTSAFDRVVAAVPDGSGGVHVSGYTDGSLGGPNAGSWDAWLAHYASGGNQLWIRQLGTSADDFAYAAAPDGSGGVYVGGETYGSLGGPFAGGTSDAWLARYDGSCGVNSSYCTAKTNSAGCVPSIATSGTPSASAGSGFPISTSNVLDNKVGLYFYSKSGMNNAPFQGGILCAQPPLVRTMLQNSGGTPPCGGAFQIDFNAYVASGKDPALVAGQQVWIQTWSRDPGFAPPDNTSLSDAVSFTLCQ